MNWNRYLEIKRDPNKFSKYFLPDNQTEAKQALALGVIDISQFIEFSLTTEPLLDMVHDPNPDMRKSAINQIAEKNTPFSMKMLHNMLNDIDEEVRLYAASEIDHLENQQQKHIHQLRQKLKQNPDDAETNFELAKTYIEYARLLVINEKLRSFFIKNAVELLDKLITENQQNGLFTFYRGFAFKMIGDDQKAIIDLKQTLSYDNNHTAAILVLVEIFFKLKKFNLVKDIFKILQLKEYEIEELNAQSFWKTEKSNN